jgi:hypothetical protein
MPKQNDPVHDLATVRKEILAYCEPLPKIIKAHGPASLGCVALSVGKCFAWIGPIVDQYFLRQPLPGVHCPTVSQLGEDLRLIGLDLMDARNGDKGELARMISTLRAQLALLEKIAKEGP